MIEGAEIYQAVIRERTKNPRFAGRLEVFDAQAHGDNPMCGDRVDVFWRQEGAVVRHDGRGCAIMAASADLMAEAASGKSPGEILALRSAFETMVNTGVQDAALGDLNSFAGVAEYRSRIKCATLPWDTLAQAIEKGSHHG